MPDGEQNSAILRRMTKFL